jgi:hypothetical protein
VAVDKSSHGRVFGKHFTVVCELVIDVFEKLSLFVAETFLSFGGFMNGKWVMEGKVSIGGACSMQSQSGALLHATLNVTSRTGVGLTIGATNVACSTLVR